MGDEFRTIFVYFFERWQYWKYKFRIRCEFMNKKAKEKELEFIKEAQKVGVKGK